jgi:hypothetical protein
VADMCCISLGTAEHFMSGRREPQKTHYDLLVLKAASLEVMPFNMTDMSIITKLSQRNTLLESCLAKVYGNLVGKKTYGSLVQEIKDLKIELIEMMG